MMDRREEKMAMRGDDKPDRRQYCNEKIWRAREKRWQREMTTKGRRKDNIVSRRYDWPERKEDGNEKWPRARMKTVL